MQQLNTDLDKIKSIIGDNYTTRNKAAVICLTDEKENRIVYCGDSFEIGNLLAYVVASYARDEVRGGLKNFLTQFCAAVATAYESEVKRTDENPDNG